MLGWGYKLAIKSKKSLKTLKLKFKTTENRDKKNVFTCQFKTQNSQKLLSILTDNYL